MSLYWGYGNGEIPKAVLHVVPNFSPIPNSRATIADGSNLMKTEAALQLSGMQRAFWKARGKVLSVSEAYRPLVVQDWYYDRFINRKPGWTLAAYPRTSIHGYALSVDLNVNGANPSGEDLAWLRANAAAYGFVNDVASEVWHWSYRTDRVARTIIVSKFISDPQAADATSSSDDHIIGRALMAAPDTISYYQRLDPKTGKDQNIYFIAGAGVFADLITADQKPQAIGRKTGLNTTQIRSQMNKMGVTSKKLAAADFDQQRIFWKTLAELN